VLATKLNGLGTHLVYDNGTGGTLHKHIEIEQDSEMAAIATAKYCDK